MAPKRRQSQRLNPSPPEDDVHDDGGITTSPPPKRRRSKRLNPSLPEDDMQDDSGIVLSPPIENSVQDGGVIVFSPSPEDEMQDDSGIVLSPPIENSVQDGSVIVFSPSPEDEMQDDSDTFPSLFLESDMQDDSDTFPSPSPESDMQDDSDTFLSPSPESGIQDDSDTFLSPSPESGIQDDNKSTSRDKAWRSRLTSMGLPEDIIDSENVDWIKIFLLVSRATSETKAEIIQFVEEIRTRTYPTSLIDPTAFQNDVGRSIWHTHCLKMDEHWQEYLKELREILGGSYPYNTMAKPSGPFGAVMHIQWHYPTNNTKKTNISFGHVVDSSNQSLLHQVKKEKDFGSDWSKIFRRCVDFSYKIMTAAPIIILIGKHAFKAYIYKFNNDPTLKLKMVDLGLHLTIFQGRASMYIAYNKMTLRIEHLIFYTYHGSHFAQGASIQSGIHSDYIWNVAASMARIPIKNTHHFMKASRDTLFTSREDGYPALKRARDTLEADGYAHLKEWREIHRKNGYPNLKKSREIQRKNGYPALKKGRETQRKNGYLALKKGLETNRNNGYPNLKKAREIMRKDGYRCLKNNKGQQLQRKLGFPNLKQGRETQRKNGYPSLQKAWAINRAKGYPGVKKGLEVNRKNGFPNLKKGQNQRAGGFLALKRGRETQRAAGFPALKKAREIQRAAGFPALKKGADTNRAKGFALRNNKFKRLLYSKEADYLLSHDIESYDRQQVGDIHDHFANLFGWSNRWKDFQSKRTSGYSRRLKESYQAFKKYRESPESFWEESIRVQRRFLAKYAIWYHKDKNPYGVPYNGPEASNNANGMDVDGYHYAICLFWYNKSGTKEFKDFVIQKYQAVSIQQEE
ncbi:hypothetical protein TrVGV298_012064 [Trichoderma virens]|nr:hypothetical protein TrVGV298_012064 [Trichoderma virens]